MTQRSNNEHIISVKKSPGSNDIDFSFPKTKMHRPLFLSSQNHHDEISDCNDRGFADESGSKKINRFECSLNLKSARRNYDHKFNLNLDRKNNVGCHKHGVELLHCKSSPFLFSSVLSLFPNWSFPVSDSSFPSSKKCILFILMKLFILAAKILRSLFLCPLNILIDMIFPMESPCDHFRDDIAAKKFCSYIKDLSKSCPSKRESEFSKVFCPFVDFSLKKLITEISPRDINNTKNKDFLHNLIIQPLLLIFIHSPLHPDSIPFLRRTLLDPSLHSLLSASTIMKCWGASVHSAEGRKVAHEFGVCGYPFLWVGRIIHTNQNVSVSLFVIKLFINLFFHR